MGTGVIIDGRGFIVTNHHVVDKVQGIEVHLFDGTNLPARVIQSDKDMDLAILKVDAGRPLPPITIGTSADLMLGETVITIGNAFGYEGTISQGIVSALKRNVTLSDDQVYRNLIQTDACINPGNSGGPLINIDGDLVGINVATRSGAQGIGFALPIDDVKRVATEMMSTRRLALKWHGLVAGRVVPPRRATGHPQRGPGEQPGRGRRASGPATNWSGSATSPVTNSLDIERALLDAQPGQPTRVVVRRDGKDQDFPLDVRAIGRTSRPRPSPRRDRPGLADPRPQGHPGRPRLRLGRLARAPRRPLRRVGHARQPRRPGVDPEGGHPGRDDRRQPPLGDDPARQRGLPPPPARGRPLATPALLHRPEQQHPPRVDEPGRGEHHLRHDQPLRVGPA